VDGKGDPNVTYLEEELERVGTTGRVILPITDPYVVHHGALGSYATIYLDDATKDKAVIDHLNSVCVYNNLFCLLLR